MQKIIINNFAAIKNAEIEIKNLLILIGEQASGKSTIAKLIYFFKSLRDDLFNQIYTDTKKDSFANSDFIFPIRQKFYDFFGSTVHFPDFEIRYFFCVEKEKYINLALDKNKKLVIQFSENFFSQDFSDSIAQIKQQIYVEISYNFEIIIFEKIAQKLSMLLNELFEYHLNNQLYIIEGRNSTISFSSFFENYFFSDLQTKLLEQSKLNENSRLAKNADEKTINEYLMFDFVKRVTKLKDIFRKYGSFDGLIENYIENDNEKAQLTFVKNTIENILKGKYVIDNLGEKIIVNNQSGEYVYLSNASSGQKESIRILQDLFMIILENQRVLRIIEEPEAHLFPVAQKQTIELLSLMLNSNTHNQLIITTHSPYVLTVINNLLFAKRVVEKSPDIAANVNEIIPEQYHLNPNGFSAYSIGNSEIGDVYCENIFNTKTGLIRQSYLDTVSEMLGGDFNQLYELHSQKFAK